MDQSPDFAVLLPSEGRDLPAHVESARIGSSATTSRGVLDLVPTLCVGTPFCRRSASTRVTQSVADSTFPRRAWERGFRDGRSRILGWFSMHCDFHIRVATDDLVFSAAHFLLWEDGTGEGLHGHSYRVAAEVFGPLDENQCVVDFIAVRHAIKAIVAELDHRVLLPGRHPAVRALADGRQIEVAFGDRRWVFPTEDCCLLPVANTTTELLAQYVGERLVAALASPSVAALRSVRIEISESGGCSAVCDCRQSQH
jgi:6-pyruvoyltetrahydropterin/6-carboxytetrahydropterin synthase